MRKDGCTIARGILDRSDVVVCNERPVVGERAQLVKVRGEVLKALEIARNEKKLINSGLEAKVLLNADLELKAKLKHYLPQLPALFIVSQVELMNAETGDFKSEAVPGLQVTVQRAEGKKCERCWNYSTHVGENPRYPTICERCGEAIAEIEAANEGK